MLTSPEPVRTPRSPATLRTVTSPLPALISVGPPAAGHRDGARAGADPGPAGDRAELDVAGAGGHVGLPVDGGHRDLTGAGAHRGPARRPGHPDVAGAGAGRQPGARRCRTVTTSGTTRSGSSGGERTTSRRPVSDQLISTARTASAASCSSSAPCPAVRRPAQPVQQSADTLAPGAARGRVVPDLDPHLLGAAVADLLVELHPDPADIDRQFQLGGPVDRPALLPQSSGTASGQSSFLMSTIPLSLIPPPSRAAGVRPGRRSSPRPAALPLRPATGERALHGLGDPRVERHALGRGGLLGLALDLLDQAQGDPADVGVVAPPNPGNRPGGRLGLRLRFRLGGGSPVTATRTSRPSSRTSTTRSPSAAVTSAARSASAFMMANRAAGSRRRRAGRRSAGSARRRPAAEARSSRSWVTYWLRSMTLLWRHCWRQSRT